MANGDQQLGLLRNVVWLFVALQRQLSICAFLPMLPILAVQLQNADAEFLGLSAQNGAKQIAVVFQDFGRTNTRRMKNLVSATSRLSPASIAPRAVPNDPTVVMHDAASQERRACRVTAVAR
jgi:hypothetical protein